MSEINTRNATLKAIVDSVIAELMIKTDANQVYLDSNTPLAPKIAEMIEAINLRAKSEDVTAQIDELRELLLGEDPVEAYNNLTKIAAYINQHETVSADMAAAIELRAKSEDVTAQIDALRQEMLGDVPVEAYDTFAELAGYIADHEDVSEALEAAIGQKADKSVVDELSATVSTLGDISTKDIITEAELDDSLKEKINTTKETADANAAAIETKADKSVVDDISATVSTLGDISTKDIITEAELDAALKEKVNAASEGNHSHSNKDILDTVDSTKVTSWDGKTKLYIGAEKPEGLSANDIWFHTTE